MTTTPPSASTILKDEKFTSDFAKFSADLDTYHQIHKEGIDVHKNYKSELSSINWNKSKDSKNPWLIFMQVMQIVLDPGSDVANNKIDSYGQESECQSALLKCQNDLQNITNTKGKYGASGLIAEARGLNELIAKLNGNKAFAVFNNGAENVSENLMTIRKQIYIGSADAKDQTNNPTAGWDATTGNFNYFFAVDASNPSNTTHTSADGTVTTTVMTSYGDMLKKMSEQGHSNAIHADSQLTDMFGTNSSILQSVSAQSKEKLSQWINTLKTLETEGSTIGQAINKLSSAAVQNMRQ